MKTFAAILILIANLWNLTNSSPLRSLFDASKPTGDVTTMQDPPDDGTVITIPPPR
ncbi:MAG TPA: hypothetical protein VH394_18730 [Thermoanaerobaculia bacterium]|jgi:hypothetical protein|nr:hypothetical protein [Thermoanaerobaculia bacterium]